MTDSVVTEIDHRGVATFTLNRPDKGNPFNGQMLAAMARQLQAWGEDARVRVIVLRGAGKHFCVGADLGPGGHEQPGAPSLADVCRLIEAVPRPMVAVVQGGCIGGGLALAGCCDVLLAQHGAFFSIPEVRLGFAAAPMAPFFLKMMGERQLRRYGLTGERFGAESALRMGVAHEICAVSDVDEVVQRLTDDLLHGAPGAVAEMKALCRTLEEGDCSPDLTAGLQRAFVAMRDGPEGVEGRAAFRDKRKPAWYPAA